MTEYLADLLCDPDLFLARIAHSAAETERAIRASNDPVATLGRIIRENDVVFVIWNDPPHQDTTGYSVMKGAGVLAKLRAGDESQPVAFNSHPLSRLRDTLSAVGTYGTRQRAAILGDGCMPVESDAIDYFSRT